MESKLRSLKARKNALNVMFNSVKSKYNRGNRSNLTKKAASAYSVLKQQDRDLFGLNYSRYINVTPSDVETSLAYIKSNDGKAQADRIMQLRETPGGMEQLFNLELASGRNIFANFKPVPAKTFRRQLNAMKISNEELEELRAGLNEAVAAPAPAPAPRSAFNKFRLSPEEMAEMNNLRSGLNSNNNSASTTSTGSFESVKSKGGRRSTKKNLKRKRNTRNRT
jgi:hypothetical protein